MAKQNTYRTNGQTVRTTDATPTVVATFVTRPNKTYTVQADIVAVREGTSANTQSAAYRRYATFRNAAGVLTQVGSTSDGFTHEDNAAWTVTVEATATSITVTVTGAAAVTVNWRCELDVKAVGDDFQYS